MYILTKYESHVSIILSAIEKKVVEIINQSVEKINDKFEINVRVEMYVTGSRGINSILQIIRSIDPDATISTTRLNKGGVSKAISASLGGAVIGIAVAGPIGAVVGGLIGFASESLSFSDSKTDSDNG